MGIRDTKQKVIVHIMSYIYSSYILRHLAHITPAILCGERDTRVYHPKHGGRGSLGNDVDNLDMTACATRRKRTVHFRTLIMYSISGFAKFNV